MNVHFAPNLANVGIGCPVCVQDVSLTTPRGNKFGEAVAHFQGAPDFSLRRVLKAGPNAFPPAVAKPGGVASRHYSPFIEFRCPKTVYNAPIVATGNGPFDVVRHSDTADRVLKINPAKKAGPGQFFAPSVELLISNGFDSGQPILYISTESSDAITAGPLPETLIVAHCRDIRYQRGRLCSASRTGTAACRRRFRRRPGPLSTWLLGGTVANQLALTPSGGHLVREDVHHGKSTSGVHS